MKKFFVLILICVITGYSVNASYIDNQLKNTYQDEDSFSVNQFTKNKIKIEKTSRKDLNIKDPKLIVLSEYKPVDDKEFKEKLAKDEAAYNRELSKFKKNNSATNSYNRVYRIMDRIIRANNLDYVNWRVQIVSRQEDFNAYTTSANLIVLYTSIIDTACDNDDILAFVIAHELSHQILDHKKISGKIREMISKFDPSAALYPVAMAKLTGKLKMMEYMADAEAIPLITRAGYSVERAMELMTYLEAATPGTLLKERYMTHPPIEKRIESILENYKYANPEWKEEGKSNLYYSNVLTLQCASDRKLIIIMKDPESKEFYKPEVQKARMLRIAYMSYLNGEMDNALKYFGKLSEKSDDYIPYLYLSYANEYKYNQTGEKQYLKTAQKTAKEAKKFAPSNKYILKQISDLKSL